MNVQSCAALRDMTLDLVNVDVELRSRLYTGKIESLALSKVANINNSEPFQSNL